MPVAAEKHTLQDLPLTITLDDGDSPMPTQKLSDLEEVEVFARLSSSGEAMRQEGDLDSKPVRMARSEEHTSELQSLMRISYAVFCLKKKKTKLTRIVYKRLRHAMNTAT